MNMQLLRLYEKPNYNMSVVCIFIYEEQQISEKTYSWFFVCILIHEVLVLNVIYYKSKNYIFTLYLLLYEYETSTSIIIFVIQYIF